MNERTKAALIGGVIAGILSVIPFVNTCCCIWAIAGGFFAGYLYFSKLPQPVTVGEGATLGAITGAIATLIYAIISVPLNLISGAANLQNAIRQLEAQGVQVPPVLAGLGVLGIIILGIVMTAVIQIVFSLLGGIIAASVFGKKGGNMPPPPPAPPQNFGGQYGR